ncbi:MAG: glycosyltransferase, partial [Flavobacteriaceae bacterium]
MRILQVIDALEVGGAEKITVMISNLLKKKNIDVSVMLLVSDGVLINQLNSEIPIYRLKRSARFSLKAMKRYKIILSEFDIIHVHLKHNFRYTQLVKKLFKIEGSKVVFHNHSHVFSPKKNRIKLLKDTLFKTIFKPQYYIGVNKDICQWANHYLRIPQEHVYLLPNTITKSEVNEAISK